MNDERRIEHWPAFDLEAVGPEHRPEFLARKKAIHLALIDRQRPSKVKLETRISPALLKKLLDKCQSLRPDGHVWGYEALIPHVKSGYVRKTVENADALDGKGKSGLFEKLLKDHPENLDLWLQDLYINGMRMPNGKRRMIRKRDMHGFFLQQCQALNIPQTQYPFTSASKGERSLYRFLIDLESKHQGKLVGRHAGESAATAFRSDAAGRPRRKPSRVFERFQLDGHYINAAAVAEIPMPSGMPLLVPLFDSWMVDLVDRDSSIAFGHHLALTGNYNRYDVQRCLASAIGIRLPHDGPTQDYLPVHFMPELSWLAFDDIELDRAMAHRAGETIDVLIDTFNARVRFGEAHTPRKRPQIEQMYEELESRGIRRLPSGLRPGDGKASRERAMKMALEHRIKVTDLEELIRRVYKKRFEDPRVKFEGRPQNEYLQYYCSMFGDSARKIPRELRERGNVLRMVREGTVTGNPDMGRRPHINLENGDYRGEIISRGRAYLGKRLKMIGDPDDARVFKAYLDGELVDHLHVRSPWDKRPHSFETRRRAMAEFRRQKINVHSLHDAVAQYELLLLERASSAAPARHTVKEVARIQRENANDENAKANAATNALDKSSAQASAVIRPGRKAINYF